MTLALVDRLRSLPRADVAPLLAALTPEERVALACAWPEFWARPDQLAPPGSWLYWWLFGAKGTGKTRAAAEWVNGRARAGLGPIVLCAGMDDDVRDTMIEDKFSGLLVCSPPDFVPEWEPSKGRVTWPNGVTAHRRSAEKPARVHGKAVMTGWYDDLTGWGPHAKETFDLLHWNYREGDARCVLTANPEESELILDLCDDPTWGIVRTDSELDQNIANLGARYEQQIARFAGSAMDLRFRKGVMVRSSRSNPFHGIDFAAPPVRIFDPGELEEIVVALDPSEGSSMRHDEYGIGAAARRTDRHVVGLEDASGRMEPNEAGEVALELLDRWATHYPAARLSILAEINRGEGRVRDTINAAHWRRVHEGRSRRPPPEVIGVRAKDGKLLRAGDLRGLYLGAGGALLHHLPGMAPCEAQQRGYNPLAPKGPAQDDRIDWWTHAVHHLAGLAEGLPPDASRTLGIGGVEGRQHFDDPRLAALVGGFGFSSDLCDPRNDDRR